MSTVSASTAWLELNDFCRKYRRATLLLHTAAHDYADARCLLLNGLFGGLALGAQAMEKLLKAYLLLKDPTWKVKALGHSVATLLEESATLYPNLGLPEYSALVEKFRGHYAARYPDDPAGSKSMTTADLLELDEFIIFLNENLPCPRNVKYRTGLYPLITFSLGPAGTVTPWERWIKERNQSLVPHLQRINAEHAAVLADLYPTRQE